MRDSTLIRSTPDSFFFHQVQTAPSHCCGNPLPPLVSTPSFPTLLFASPPMATVGGGYIVCGECGKVCKSCSGLVKHTAAHKRHPRIGDCHGDFHRVYHPTLNNNVILPFQVEILLTTQGNPVTETGHFFHPELPNSSTLKAERRLDTFHLMRWVRTFRGVIYSSIPIQQYHR